MKTTDRGAREHFKAIEFLRGVAYVASFPDRPSLEKSLAGPMVAFVGRSNSGKSTLLSSLCDHAGLAHASRRAGKTRLLNAFHVPAHGDLPEFHLIDLPGYGYAALPKAEQARLRRMVDDFLLNAERLVLIVLVLDARRKTEAEEEGVLGHSRATERPVVFARTKWDRLNATEKRAARSRWRGEPARKIMVPVSAPKRLGLREILVAIREAVAPS